MRKFTFILVLMAALLAASQALTAEVGTAQYYLEQGNEHLKGGKLDQAIADYTRALEINARDALAYNSRAVAFYFKKAYDQAWEDVRKAQSLGYKINPEFLEALRKTSGREK